MPSIVLHCPNCRQPYQMSPELITKYAGRTITCRKCKQPFAFDAAMDAAAQAAGQAEPEEEASVVGTAASGGGAEASANEGHGAYATQESYTAPVVPPAPPPPPLRPAAPVAQQSAPPFPPQAVPAPPPPAYAPPAYPSSPGAPVGYAPAAEPGGGIGDLFGFRRMALPSMLPLFFWLGVGYCIYNGLRLLLGFVLVSGFRGSAWGTPTFSTHVALEGLFDRVISIGGMYTILDALFWFILGPLFFRGFCDLILAASRLLASERK
jgi:hypothetical protein